MGASSAMIVVVVAVVDAIDVVHIAMHAGRKGAYARIRRMLPRRPGQEPASIAANTPWPDPFLRQKVTGTLRKPPRMLPRRGRKIVNLRQSTRFASRPAAAGTRRRRRDSGSGRLPRGFRAESLGDVAVSPARRRGQGENPRRARRPDGRSTGGRGGSRRRRHSAAAAALGLGKPTGGARAGPTVARVDGIACVGGASGVGAANAAGGEAQGVFGGQEVLVTVVFVGARRHRWFWLLVVLTIVVAV
mmetsp:Transcript_26342/g.54332  ORF Transcript_26342/g.54332 Transcript_26342/m.54332 type:complete len:246 (-) Transcript_26342:44-781(-)